MSGKGASSLGALPGNVVLPVKYASRQNGGSSRNAHLHPYESTIREPTAGPVATPSAVSEPHLATVVIRAESGVTANNSPNDAGVSNAPPTPWMRRARITIEKFGAAPTSIDETAKIARPIMKTRRRPNLSAKRPAGIRRAAKAMV